MFWKRPSNAAAPAVVSVPPTLDDGDRALDTIADIVRAYGAAAFDTDQADAEQVREGCERWASKILIGAGGEEAGEKGLRRDFGGIRRYFKELRRGEVDYVTRSLGDLREAVQCFARCMRTAVNEDRASNEHVGGALTALSTAVEINDTRAIRAQALSVIDVVRTSIATREERHRAQVEAMADQLRRLQSELSAARQQAALDGLTKLFNRASFDAHVERIADLGLLLGMPPCAFMIDVDHFKTVNDTHGHPTGDEVLRRVADCVLRQFLRREDFVARYGGEEFAVVVLDARLDDVRRLAERLLSSVRALDLEIGGSRPRVTVSVGAALLVSGESATDWIARADRALYDAKEGGRDRARFAPLPAAFA
jgi:diguanylate cyclase (GGDEF)-like protein